MTRDEEGAAARLRGPGLPPRIPAALLAPRGGRCGVATPRRVAPAPAGPVGQAWQQPAAGDTRQFATPPYTQQPYGQPYPPAEYAQPPVTQPPHHQQPHDPPPVPQQEPLPPVPPPAQ